MLRRFGRGRVALAALALGLAIWAIAIEPARLVLRDETVEVSDWRGGPLNVALIADLHVGAPHFGVARMREVAALVAAQRPDLVLMLGDYTTTGMAGGTEVDPNEWTPFFGTIPARLGVFAVLGNHDWWNDSSGTQAALEAGGVTVLENAARPIDTGAGQFWLVGIGDTFTGHDRGRAPLRHLRRWHKHPPAPLRRAAGGGDAACAADEARRLRGYRSAPAA